ncbi:MAG: CBS domain-containing protein [Methanothermobacter sp.]|nr:CBS domain-containing protein [Methanothermobacter sp.]
MTPDPITLKPSSTVEEALEIVFKYKHMGYPVTENGELKGIVTFQDLSSADKSTLIRDVMTEDVITVDIDDDAMVALEKLTSHDLGRLPVMKEGKLVGIISKTDLIRTLDIMRRTRT